MDKYNTIQSHKKVKSMEFKKTGKSAFEIERDQRLKVISEKSLWQLLRDRVKINGKPIAHRTARDMFKLESFDKVIGLQLRIWLAAAEVIEEYNRELETYGTECKEVEPSSVD